MLGDMKQLDYITPREAAEVAGVTRQHISRLCRTDPHWKNKVMRIAAPRRASAAITLIPRALAVAYAEERAE